MKLKHSVVLITGASSGLGAATALRCALRKAKLVLAARSALSPTTPETPRQLARPPPPPPPPSSRAPSTPLRPSSDSTV